MITSSPLRISLIDLLVIMAVGFDVFLKVKAFGISSPTKMVASKPLISGVYFSIHFAVNVTLDVGVYVSPASPILVSPKYQPSNTAPVLVAVGRVRVVLFGSFHFAYNVTVAPLVDVRFLTDWLSEYFTAPLDVSAHPANV